MVCHEIALTKEEHITLRMWVYHDALTSAADGRILLCQIQPHHHLASDELINLKITTAVSVLVNL